MSPTTPDLSTPLDVPETEERVECEGQLSLFDADAEGGFTSFEGEKL